MKTVVFINKNAANGNGAQKWKKIEAQFRRLYAHEFDVVLYSPPYSFFKDFDLTCYERVIIGGGDGSVHCFINELIKQEDAVIKKISVGAIGLGSSNDLHKPFHRKIDKIPVKIGPDVTIHDLGKVTIRNEEQTQCRYFLINASLGITAYGNHLFNHPDRFLKMIKANFTNLAINYTALKSILSYKNEELHITTDTFSKPMLISSINVIKNPHITGGLHFDQEIQSDDGFLGLHICENMNKRELINTFSDLGKGKFSGKPKRYSSFEKQLSVYSKNVTPLELDGEIYYGTSFIFDVLPKQIRLLK